MCVCVCVCMCDITICYKTSIYCTNVVIILVTIDGRLP